MLLLEFRYLQDIGRTFIERNVLVGHQYEILTDLPFERYSKAVDKCSPLSRRKLSLQPEFSPTNNCRLSRPAIESECYGAVQHVTHAHQWWVVSQTHVASRINVGPARIHYKPRHHGNVQVRPCKCIGVVATCSLDAGYQFPEDAVLIKGLCKKNPFILIIKLVWHRNHLWTIPTYMSIECSSSSIIWMLLEPYVIWNVIRLVGTLKN